MIRLTLAALLLAGSASAATITTDAGPRLNTTTFAVETRNLDGEPGNGYSVINGGLSFVRKTDPAAPDAAGRFPLYGLDFWEDSQDQRQYRMTITGAEPFTRFSFGMTDMCDQVGSHCAVHVKGGNTVRWTGGRPNGVVDYLSLLLEEAERTATLKVTARKGSGGHLNDGHSYNVAPMSPVPLPAAAWLLLAGLGAMAWVKRRVVA